jgi:hypothetical protein
MPIGPVARFPLAVGPVVRFLLATGVVTRWCRPPVAPFAIAAIGHPHP